MMDEVNGTTKKKQVLFSIGSYSDRNKRVINKIKRNSLFATSGIDWENAATSKELQRKILNDRPVDSYDTTDFPKYNTLPRLHKFPAEKPRENGERKTIREPENVEKPKCPPSVNNDYCVLNEGKGTSLDKPINPPTFFNRSVSLEPEQLRHTGKVALTIAAYEGEPKTPTRLEFLPHARLSRSSSKASSEVSSPLEEEQPIGSRLQNELVATLKRSNLKKRNDQTLQESEEDILSKTNGSNSSEGLKNGKQLESEQSNNDDNIANGSVKKLATELDKIIVFNVNTENGEQND